MSIRVGIADDQPLIRTGLRTMIEHTKDLVLVAEAEDGEQAVALARRHRPDVLLMDIRMPKLDGIEATRRITSRPTMASVRVVVLTTFDSDEYVYDGDTRRRERVPAEGRARPRMCSTPSAWSPTVTRCWCRV